VGLAVVIAGVPAYFSGKLKIPDAPELLSKTEKDR